MKTKKHMGLKLGAAAAAVSLLTISASADDMMTLRLSAEKTAFTTDELASEDAVVHGGLYIDNYTGISRMRAILKSDPQITIENGDFTRVEGEKGPDGETQLAFFKDYSLAGFTQKSAIDDDTNISLFHGTETGVVNHFNANGEIYKADSSYVSYDIRIPKGTAAGDYVCTVDTELRKLEDVDMYEAPFYASSYEKNELELDKDIAIKPLVVSVYTRGDVNCDGEISVEDAQAALVYYVNVIVTAQHPDDAALAKIFGTTSINAAKLAADASQDSTITSDDAQGILVYYTEKVAKNKPSWDKIFK